MYTPNIGYAWYTDDEWWNSSHPAVIYPHVDHQEYWSHRDWGNKPCGGTITYAHRSGIKPDLGWWMCGLCSRKVVAYMPDPLIAAAQEALNASS